LGDKGGFLGDPTKRVSESPTGLNFAKHIIRVNDAELGFRSTLKKREVR